MIAIAGSLYLLATMAFALIATIVGIRLIRLSLRTGRRPERLLGLGVMLTAGLGYGVMILGMVARQALIAKGRDPGLILDARHGLPLGI